MYFGLYKVGNVSIPSPGYFMGMPRCWHDGQGNVALLDGSAWSALCMHILDVWIANPTDGRKLIMKQELGTVGLNGGVPEPCVRVIKYNVPTNLAEVCPEPLMEKDIIR